MKKLFILLIFGLLSGIAYSPQYKYLYLARAEKIKPYEKTWKAICLVESSNNPRAYNKKENAVGIVQVREIRLDDYNKQTGQRYKLTDMYDPVLAKSIFVYYAKQYDYKDIERIARCWNAGQNGMRIKASQSYYKKVLRALKSISK